MWWLGRRFSIAGERAFRSVIPAQAGIQHAKHKINWIPAFAGMTSSARTAR
jgi:hypothetical protein